MMTAPHYPHYPPYPHQPHQPHHAEIRPARAADAAAVGRFVQGLSEHSRRWRFHGAVSGDSPALQKLLCDVDGRCHQAWLAWSDAGRGPIVVGEARFVLSSADDTAELAIAVADEWQGRGLADRMLHQLLVAASAAGVSQLYGDVMANNGRMRAFMRRNCFETRRVASGELVRLSRTLAPRALASRSAACA